VTLSKLAAGSEGEAGTRLTIGAIRYPPQRPVAAKPNLSKSTRASRSEGTNAPIGRARLLRREARRKFAERFAEASPEGIGEKGEASSDQRVARGALGRLVSRGSRRRHDCDSRRPAQPARHRSRHRRGWRASCRKPPAQLEVRDRSGGASRDQWRHACGGPMRCAMRRDAAFSMCAARYRHEGPASRAGTGGGARDHPEHRRGTGERHARRFHLRTAPRRQRAGSWARGVPQYPPTQRPMAGGLRVAAWAVGAR